MKRKAIVGMAVLAVVASVGFARSQEKTRTARIPEVAGAWTGTWQTYVAPEDKEKAKKVVPLQLDCKVVQEDGKWQATFEGECGRPYKYTIKMEGRQAYNTVMFKGTTDLGEKDGGVYDWIGRADGKEFVGFYTSGGHVGTFRLMRRTGEAKAAAK